MILMLFCQFRIPNHHELDAVLPVPCSDYMILTPFGQFQVLQNHDSGYQFRIPNKRDPDAVLPVLDSEQHDPDAVLTVMDSECCGSSRFGGDLSLRGAGSKDF